MAPKRKKMTPRNPTRHEITMDAQKEGLRTLGDTIPVGVPQVIESATVEMIDSSKVTPFAEMKEGPVKRIVEREMRSLMNDVEKAVWLMYRNVKHDGNREMLPEDVMVVFKQNMAERGITPNGQ